MGIPEIIQKIFVAMVASTNADSRYFSLVFLTIFKKLWLCRSISISSRLQLDSSTQELATLPLDSTHKLWPSKKVFLVIQDICVAFLVWDHKKHFPKAVTNFCTHRFWCSRKECSWRKNYVCHTVWKFQNISIFQILREINFEDYRSLNDKICHWQL